MQPLTDRLLKRAKHYRFHAYQKKCHFQTSKEGKALQRKLTKARKLFAEKLRGMRAENAHHNVTLWYLA